MTKLCLFFTFKIKITSHRHNCVTFIFIQSCSISVINVDDFEQTCLGIILDKPSLPTSQTSISLLHCCLNMQSNLKQSFKMLEGNFCNFFWTENYYFSSKKNSALFLTGNLYLRAIVTLKYKKITFIYSY